MKGAAWRPLNCWYFFQGPSLPNPTAPAQILLRLRYAPAPQNPRPPGLTAQCPTLTARCPGLIAPPQCHFPDGGSEFGGGGRTGMNLESWKAGKGRRRASEGEKERALRRKGSATDWRKLGIGRWDMSHAGAMVRNECRVVRCSGTISCDNSFWAAGFVLWGRGHLRAFNRAPLFASKGNFQNG